MTGDDGAPRRLTWLGHATVLVELDGVRVLTDPALTGRVAHLRRHRHVDVAGVETPDAVVISHVHMDHLHVPSLRLLRRDVRLIVPEGAAEMLRRRGFGNVEETTVGRSTSVDGVDIETVPAAHSGRRGPHSRLAVDAVGYVLRVAECSIYFPGDTDLFPGMASLGPIDVALLPIGGWGRSLGEGHLDPRRAAQAATRLRPRVVVPIHWGTYSPLAIRRGAPGWLDDPLHKFVTALEESGLAVALRVLSPGATMAIPPRPPASPAVPGRSERPDGR